MSEARRRSAGGLQGVLMCLNTVLVVMGGFLIAPILPEMQTHFAAVPHCDLLIGLTLTIPAGLLAVFSPLVGALADRYGRRRLLLVALALYAVFGTAPIWLDSLYAIVVTRALVGIVEAVLMTASTALLSDYFDAERRQAWLGIRGIIATLAVGVMLIIGGLAHFDSWRLPFFAYGASLLLILPTVIWTWETASAATSKATLREPLPWDHLGRIGWLAVFGAIVFAIVPFQTGFILAARGFSEPSRASLASGIGIAFGPIGALLAIWSVRYSAGRVLAAAMAMMGLALLIIGAAHMFALIVLGICLQQIGGSLMLAVALNYCMAGLAPSITARGAGMWWLLYGAGGFITPFVTSAAIALTGSSAGALGVFGFLCFAACVPLLLALPDPAGANSVAIDPAVGLL